MKKFLMSAALISTISVAAHSQPVDTVVPDLSTIGNKVLCTLTTSGEEAKACEAQPFTSTLSAAVTKTLVAQGGLKATVETAQVLAANPVIQNVGNNLLCQVTSPDNVAACTAQDFAGNITNAFAKYLPAAEPIKEILASGSAPSTSLVSTALNLLPESIRSFLKTIVATVETYLPLLTKALAKVPSSSGTPSAS